MSAIESLARAFSANLRRDLTAEQMAEVNRLNATADAGICHSHDFLDANVTMEEAWIAIFDRVPDIQSDADCALWGEAWDLAKANRFWAASD